MNQLILALILSVLPVFELRGGIPVAVDYAIKNNINILPIFLLIILLNILVVWLIFLFLDYVHDYVMKFKWYRQGFEYLLRRTQKKVDKIEKKMGVLGFFALTLFVAIPLPVTGAWTGALIAWILGLERKRSFLAIALGVVIAGILVLLASYGILSFFN